MTKAQATRKAQALIEDLPEGSVCVVVFQLPGASAEVVSSEDSNRDTAAGLRYVADRLSPAGDA